MYEYPVGCHGMCWFGIFIVSYSVYQFRILFVFRAAYQRDKYYAHWDAYFAQENPRYGKPICVKAMACDKVNQMIRLVCKPND